MKKIYPILIVTVLVMSFIITYAISEGKFNNYAFAEIFAEEAEGIAGKAQMYAKAMIVKPPLKELEYSIERSGVKYDTKIVYNDEKYVDYEEVVQKGASGFKKSVYQENYVDGELVLRALEEEIVYIDPIDEIIEVGTKERQVATSRGGIFRFSNEMDMVATAYDLSYESCGKYPDHPEYGITRSGTKAQPGTVAVDPSVIPLGTKLYIASTDGSPDYGFATAEDTGSAIKGYRVDLFMEDNQDALNFGIRPVKVYVLD